MQVTTTKKLAIRVAILTVGLVGALYAGTVQPVPAADGGPILLCPPGSKTCSNNLPSMADGGPILLCPPGSKTCKPDLPPAIS